MNLAERFYDPDQGSVFLDGIDLKAWSNDRFRQLVSVCMQDVFIFAGSLEDNIAATARIARPRTGISNSSRLASHRERWGRNEDKTGISR